MRAEPRPANCAELCQAANYSEQYQPLHSLSAK
jgi:hypothetical protein